MVDNCTSLLFITFVKKKLTFNPNKLQVFNHLTFAHVSV